MIVTDVDDLTAISKDTTEEEVTRLGLVEKIKESYTKAWTKGCGLAAIQVGYPLRFAWFIFDGKEETLLNPKILTGIGKTTMEEGCLSVPNRWEQVERYVEIEYESHGKKKRAKGFKARIIQHEIDHMNGVLIIHK